MRVTPGPRTYLFSAREILFVADLLSRSAEACEELARLILRRAARGEQHLHSKKTDGGKSAVAPCNATACPLQRIDLGIQRGYALTHVAVTMQSLLSPSADMSPHWLGAESARPRPSVFVAAKRRSVDDQAG
jgi:hypothetical protein